MGWSNNEISKKYCQTEENAAKMSILLKAVWFKCHLIFRVTFWEWFSQIYWENAF